MRLRIATFVLTCAVSLTAAAGAAQALVVHDHGTDAGVTIVPGSTPDLTGLGITSGTSSSSCADPMAVPGLPLPADAALCWQGGPVIHGNETFAVAWDAKRRYWSTTRAYVEQFMQDVATGSGTLTSPYAVASQYSDGSGRAANNSVYGGGCIDYGDLGGSGCQFGTSGMSLSGNQYPSNSCPASGSSYIAPGATATNDVCLTDASLHSEVTAMLGQLQSAGIFRSGYTPLLTMLMPPGVEVCLDSAGRLCSVNSSAPATFCSYHSFVDVSGTDYPYVVQPWTPYSGAEGCDEPKLPVLEAPWTDVQLATAFGVRLVSPLSAAQIAAMTDPDLNGWVANSGGETSDNGVCAPEGVDLDTVNVGPNSYVLWRAFNNGAALESDPNAQPCLPQVGLDPTFVAPSPVDPGDVVAFDGSATRSTLMVTNGNFQWDFGDGTTAIGPSVVHSYGKGGTYTVTLTVTDRGGYHKQVAHQVQVSGAQGNPGPPQTQTQTSENQKSMSGSTALQVHLQLLPQSVKGVLRQGLALRVTSTQPANGLATVLLARSSARHAHMKVGRKQSAVVIGRGTLSGIKSGTVTLHMKLSRATAKKLLRLKHMSVTVRLALSAASGARVTVDAAGNY
jgi:chitodextrinase